MKKNKEIIPICINSQSGRRDGKVKQPSLGDRIYLSSAIATTVTTGFMCKYLVKVIGKMDHTIDHTFESANRVYSINGLCPTIPTCGGGNIQPKIIKESKMTETEKDENEPEYAIRKLTPKECMRLMGVADEDTDKVLSVNSNSQTYKIAGNAIVVDVLCAIFSQMNIKGVETWNKKHE